MLVANTFLEGRKLLEKTKKFIPNNKYAKEQIAKLQQDLDSDIL